MIIVKLQGGLGNQMFQAAAGIALSKHFKTELKLDLTFLQNNNISTDNFTARTLGINQFDYGFEIANADDLSIFPTKSGSLPLLYIRKVFNKKYRSVVIKDTWNPDKKFEIATAKTYLDGFWQSEKYFKPYRSDLLNIFKFPDTPAGILELYHRIKATNSVSVHFRRGDYVNLEKTRSIHNVCNLDYYSKAIEYISARQKDIKLYLFSDEPEWLISNFKSDIEFEIINTSSDIIGMNLMVNCKHNIIANSSFSWWGAWLNRNPEKIVVAPKRWFATDIADDKNIVPETWNKI